MDNSQNTDVEDFDEITDDISVISLEDTPTLLLFVFMIVIVGLQFFTRYVLNDSLSWTEEAARYCLILLTFLGSAICVRQGTHLTLGLIYRYVPKYAVRPLAIFNEIVTAGFFAWIGFIGIAMMERTARQKLITLPLPKSYIYTIITIACAVAILYGLRNIWQLRTQMPEDIVRERLGGI